MRQFSGTWMRHAGDFWGGLAAMLVAQALNQRHHPVYGCYVKGNFWSFMTLRERQYCISQPYVATRDDVFDIFRILKALKTIVAELIEQQNLRNHLNQ